MPIARTSEATIAPQAGLLARLSVRLQRLHCLELEERAAQRHVLLHAELDDLLHAVDLVGAGGVGKSN